jgi:hypothetical protein
MAAPPMTSLGFSIPLKKNIQPEKRLRVPIGNGNFRTDAMTDVMGNQYSKK